MEIKDMAKMIRLYQKKANSNPLPLLRTRNFFSIKTFIAFVILSGTLLAISTINFMKNPAQAPQNNASVTLQNQSIFDTYHQQALSLVAKMNLEQKIGQLILPTFDFLANSEGPHAIENGKKSWHTEKDLLKLGQLSGMQAISDFHLGAVLQAGNPNIFSGENQGSTDWKKLSDMAKLFYHGPEGTSLLLGTDAIHGDQHVTGTILFPHNIGLGATHNPALIEKVAYWTMRNVANTGFNWSFTPTVALAQDYRWGRTYESFNANPEVIKSFVYHYVKGLQQIHNHQITGILASAKHFIGDGSTKNGVDQGYATTSNLEAFWKEHGLGYEGAVQANSATLMASYSSLNDIPMHFGGDDQILNRFRNEGIQGSNGESYRFRGFVVSDYLGVSKAAYKESLITGNELSYVKAIAKSMNAGVDMFMVANGAYKNLFDYNSEPPYEMLGELFYSTIKEVRDSLIHAVNQQLISQERLDEAVKRILQTKLALSNIPIPINAQEHKEEAHVSLEAAEQSLVLLKNEEQLIPLAKDHISHVFLLGDYDDIGTQNGGWTVTWQGQKGNQYWTGENKKQAAASSILDGIKEVLSDKAKFYQGEEVVQSTDFSIIHPKNGIAFLVLSEPPYAEFMGDVGNENPLYIKGVLDNLNPYMPKKQSQFLEIKLSEEQQKAVAQLKSHGIKIITILFSGRPMVITDGGAYAPLQNSDAFIAAFLPGTGGGQAIANAIFGKYGFKSIQNKIGEHVYFSNTLPFAWPRSMEEVVSHEYTLFPVGYGLQTKTVN